MVPLDEMYEKYYRDVYRFTLALSQNTQAAEDIAQETFLKAMDAISSFRGECDIKTWLCQIAKNTFYTRATKQKREVLDGDETIREIAEDYDFVKATVDEEQAMRIHKILHNLQEPYKEVFNLRVFGELSFKQIAGIHGKTESWARVTYHRARVMIIQQLEI